MRLVSVPPPRPGVALCLTRTPAFPPRTQTRSHSSSANSLALAARRNAIAPCQLQFDFWPVHVVRVPRSFSCITSNKQAEERKRPSPWPIVSPDRTRLPDEPTTSLEKELSCPCVQECQVSRLRLDTLTHTRTSNKFRRMTPMRQTRPRRE